MLHKLKSIRWKIISLYLMLLIITLVFSGYLLQDSLKNYFSHWLDRQLVGEMKLLVGIIKPLVKAENRPVLDKMINKYGKQLETRITIVDDSGKVLADSREDPTEMDNHLYRPEIQEALRRRGIGKEIRHSATLDIDMRYVALPIESNKQVLGIIRFAISLDKLNRFYYGIWKVLLQTGVIAFIISIILSFKFSSQITNPIGEMTSAVQRIANGFLDQKLVIRTEDEIGRLAQMFNHMVKKLKNKMQQISSEKSKVEAIVTSIGDGIIATNEHGEIILINLTIEELFAVKEEEMLGKSVIQMTRSYKLDELINKALIKGESLTEEIELLLPEERIFRVRLALIEREEQAAGVVVSLRDITDIKQLEQMRKDFVSNVSHELKTPLTSIKGYVETLMESELESGTYNSFLKVINDEAERLEHLINDILDLSKIESSDSLLKENVDMVEVVNGIIPVVEPKAQRKNIILNLDVPAKLPIIKGNKDQLSRLMINLVDNAIKYTPSGGKVEVRSYSEDNNIVIEVEDNGIGIPQEDISRIFERFYRVNKARSRKLGGTGLGLSIVKHIVEQHQGIIEVESELEKGTKFIVRL
ncbi:PAS domain S-box [Halobacteroides halobius DSM 5150]|uniref:histidine kinase n=1 Tax=Halobacteroides halobius (strain ATCC 35273 / DSM 5150 / MD-1) TaxID=748449 RepID=L0K6C6_HALHC|nr:ATP-binding protein [Halobacteroides halobius]AGB40792.1 PAS domain S-box [Halobacteroides halobius DSM 5150]